MQASLVATHLVRVGAQKGDRVLLISENSLFWVACYLGILQAGLVCVPIAANARRDLDYILESTEAKVVCAQASVAMAQTDLLAKQHILTDRECLPLSRRLHNEVCLL